MLELILYLVMGWGVALIITDLSEKLIGYGLV